MLAVSQSAGKLPVANDSVKVKFSTQERFLWQDMWKYTIRTTCFVYLKITSACCIPFKEKVICGMLKNGFSVSVDIIGILTSRSLRVKADLSLNWLFSASVWSTM